jgi:hypothetical protein
MQQLPQIDFQSEENAMNCKICGRTLKNPTPEGMGRICAMKAHRLQDSDSRRTEIKLIYNNGRGHRNYLVNRQFVSVRQEGSERYGVCGCADYKNGIKCNHLELVAVEDANRFQARSAA